MTLCSRGHSEVCYESRFCPACEIQEELDAARDEILNLDDQVKQLEEELKNQ